MRSLARLRRDVDSLKLKVGYPGVFHVPAATAYFRIFLQPGVLDLNVVGDLSASLDGQPLDVLLGDGREATLMTGDEGTLLLKVSLPASFTAVEFGGMRSFIVQFCQFCKKAM